jgi:hypothetical protein
MPKTKPKPPKKKKAPPPLPRRPIHVPPPKPKKRMREAAPAVPPKPIKKASQAMTEPTTKAHKAPDAKTADEPISIKDRRAELLQQAEENEAANDEAYEAQVEANKDFAARMEKANDPDERDKADAAAAKAAGAKPKYTPSPTTPDFKQGQAAG